MQRTPAQASRPALLNAAFPRSNSVSHDRSTLAPPHSRLRFETLNKVGVNKQHAALPAGPPSFAEIPAQVPTHKPHSHCSRPAVVLGYNGFRDLYATWQPPWDIFQGTTHGYETCKDDLQRTLPFYLDREMRSQNPGTCNINMRNADRHCLPRWRLSYERSRARRRHSFNTTGFPQDCPRGDYREETIA